MVVIDVVCPWHCFYNSVWLRLVTFFLFPYLFPSIIIIKCLVA